MSFKDLGSDAEAVLDLEPDEIEIVPMDLELHKPLDFDEAIEALKAEKKRQFIVFNDYDGNMRVMYKRADGKFWTLLKNISSWRYPHNMSINHYWQKVNLFLKFTRDYKDGLPYILSRFARVDIYMIT